jgi:hypothetical protein
MNTMQESEVKTLPKEFRSDGFDFRLIMREGDIGLLVKTKRGWVCSFWEVVKIQHLSEKLWPNGQITPAHEAMPASESWGTKGWSFSIREKARQKLDSMTARGTRQDDRLAV